MKNKKKTNKRSGGIATLVKKEFTKYFRILPTDCEYVQWFKFSNVSFNVEEDVVFGADYLPPENTKYLSQNIFDMFYSEIEHFNNTNKYVLLMGDFNARTGLMCDLTDIDEQIYEYIDVDTNSVFDKTFANMLSDKNILLGRHSQDDTCNKFG